jgi:hypothetical protein
MLVSLSGRWLGVCATGSACPSRPSFAGINILRLRRQLSGTVVDFSVMPSPCCLCLSACRHIHAEAPAYTIERGPSGNVAAARRVPGLLAQASLPLQWPGAHAILLIKSVEQLRYVFLS